MGLWCGVLRTGCGGLLCARKSRGILAPVRHWLLTIAIVSYTFETVSILMFIAIHIYIQCLTVMQIFAFLQKTGETDFVVNSITPQILLTELNLY